jgi:hypothetical protein
MSDNTKRPFWRDVLEAMVIRTDAFENKPKVEKDSFGGDLANAVLLRPVYRKPKGIADPAKVNKVD